MNIQNNISLKKLNTFGIDVMARYFATFNSVEALQELSDFVKPPTLKLTNHTSHIIHQTLVLGGGSNILFTKNVDGLVLKNEIGGIQKINEDDEYIYVKAGAGENWHGFVLYCLENNYAGVENLALIPGSVGASPMQNIGAYGVEIKDVFHSLEAWSIAEKKIIVFDKAACSFGYRESIFKNKYKGEFIITSVTYLLKKKPVLNTSYGAIETEMEKNKVIVKTIQAIAQAVINIRSSKLPDPKVIGNAGSFFKNPEIGSSRFREIEKKHPGVVGYPLPNGNVKLAAGWLIEHCGPHDKSSWKGYRKGDAGCHEKQALVLVNYGNATGSEMLDLSTSILQSVFEKFGVRLEREVNIF